MKFSILNKQLLANGVKRIDVYAPDIVAKIKPGQFVSVCPEENDERIPLTVVDTDVARKSIALIFQEVGLTTKKMGAMAIKENLFSILGPLGMESEIKTWGNVICVATGVGAVRLLPIIRALKAKGNKVTGVVGAKTKRSLLLEPQMRLACDRVFIATNDGSYERKGQATDILEELINKKEVNLVYAIGSVDMMQNVCEMTASRAISIRVQLTPVMVDCMGMCGSCRVKVGGEVKLACIDGPEFDGHEVDFKNVRIRMNAFKEFDQWHSRKWQHSQEKKESKILTRFLSGILKE